LDWNRNRAGAKVPKHPNGGLGNTALAVLALVLLAAGLVRAHASGTSFQRAQPTVVESAACPDSNILRLSLDRASASRVIAKPPDYTQGLLFADGALYEGTGIVGQSAIYRLDLSGGPRSTLFALDRSLFGEGLARIGDQFYQLTWKDGLAFAYEYDDEKRSFRRSRTFRRNGQGWGLTDLAGALVLSDGTERLSFVDPATFAVKRVIQVRLGSRAVTHLNELESVGEAILANIYGDGRIVSIDPSTGCIDAVIDATPLVAGMVSELEALAEPICSGPCSGWDFVLNGIAYDADKSELYLTGKNWPAIFVYRDLFR
jgi:glutamine cyclotransferase